MAQHLWTVLCTNSSIDQTTNNVSLFGVVEQLQIGGGAPTDQRIIIPAQFQLVILWMRSNLDQPEMATARFSLQSPNGEVSPGGEVQVELSTAIRSRNVITINGLPVNGPGVYKFITEIRGLDEQEWTRVHELPVQIIFS